MLGKGKEFRSEKGERHIHGKKKMKRDRLKKLVERGR